MARNVGFDVNVGDGASQPTARVTTAMERLAQRLEEAGRTATAANVQMAGAAESADDLGDQANQAARGVDDLSEEMAQASAQAGRLDRALESTRERHADLLRELDRTGDMQLIPQIKDEAGLLRTLSRLRGELDAIGKESDKDLPVAGLVSSLTDAGSEGGGGFGKAFTAAAGTALKDAAGALKGGPALIAIGAALSPTIAAAVSAGLLAGIGGAGIAVGIAGAAQDPRIKAAAADLAATVKGELAHIGAPFVGPVLDGIAQLKKTAQSLDLDDVFAPLADSIGPLVDGLDGLVAGALPGLKSAFAAAAPVIGQLADDLPELGDDIGDFFDSIASAGPGAEKILHVVVETIGTAIDVIGEAIEAGSKWAGFWLGIWEKLGVVDFSDTEKGLQQVGATGTSSLDAVAVSAERVAQAEEDARKATEDFHNSLRGLFDANVAVEQGMDDLAESVKENGRSLDVTTQKGRDNVGILERMVEAAQRAGKSAYDASVAEGDLGNASAKAGAAMEEQMAKIRAKASSLGFTKAQVDALITSLLGLPTGDKYLNYTVTTHYRYTGQDRQEQIAYGAGIQPHATGGPITGIGTETSDSNLVALSRGEHVMTAAEVRAAGGHGAVTAWRKSLLAGGTASVGGGGFAARGGSGGVSAGGSVVNITVPVHAGMITSPDEVAGAVAAALRAFVRDNGPMPELIGNTS